MTGFTFYKSFYETIKKVRNSRDRANAILAICEYMFEDKVPDENTSETVEIVFQSVRHTLDKSKKNGVSGSETKPKRTKIETESNGNRNKIELQSNENRNEIETETRSRSRSSISSITPLFISPQSGDEKKSVSDEFFAKYPRYAKDRGKFSESYDYKRLLEEFEKSSYLRSLYTAKQVVELYPLIVTGEYRDKEQSTKAADGVEERAKRERWYALRREKAISQAEKVRERFMQDETFAKIYKRLSAIEVEQARAEVQGDKQKLAKLEQERSRLRLQKQGIIERNGLAEEDLEPKWNCTKCKDTGFVDGKACDCYEG